MTRVRTGRSRPRRLAVVAVAGALVAVAALAASAVASARDQRPAVPSRHLPRDGTSSAGRSGPGCVGQSVNRAERYLPSPREAVLAAETALVPPPGTSRPMVALEPPPGAPRSVDRHEYTDGGWTFRLAGDARRGWAVTETTYCPARSS